MTSDSNLQLTAILINAILTDPRIIWLLLGAFIISILVTMSKYDTSVFGPIRFFGRIRKGFKQNSNSMITENVVVKFQDLWDPIAIHCKTSLQETAVKFPDKDAAIFLDNTEYALDTDCKRLVRQRLLENHFASMTPDALNIDIDELISHMRGAMAKRLNTRRQFITGYNPTTDLEIKGLHEKITYSIKQLKEYKTDISVRSGKDYNTITQHLRTIDDTRNMLVIDRDTPPSKK